jgi:coproporphyrinogen III oxidase-like Fe-S oxidoreductase
VESVRKVNAQKIPDYIQRMKNPEPDNSKSPGSPATISRYSVDQITQRRDYMMLGLRLIKEGVNRTDFKRRYGLDMSVLFQTEIELLLGQRLVERVEGDEGRLRLSKRGIMLANRVFREFV